MKTTAPHYLLLTDADVRKREADEGSRWRFVLEQMDGEDRVEVSEREPNVWGERLELLAIVRGLEALEQPSKVTLITASKYVGRRLRHGFNQWKEDGWRWESFGKMTPVKHADLWKRIDQAMQFHSVECRIWQWAAAYKTPIGESSSTPKQESTDSLCEKIEAESLDELEPERRIVFKRRRSGPRIEESSFANDFNSTEVAESTRYQSESTIPVSNRFHQPPKSSATVFDDRNFFQAKQSRSSRVVEIDPDQSQPVSFPQAFGCTIN